MTPAFPFHLDELKRERKVVLPSSEHTQIHAIGLLLGSVPRQEAWVVLFFHLCFFALGRSLAFEQLRFL